MLHAFLTVLLLQITSYVIEFLHRGAAANTVDENGNTPLHLAATRGFTDVAKALLSHDADVEACNDQDYTPLELAIQHGLQDYSKNEDYSDFAILMIKKMQPHKYVPILIFCVLNQLHVLTLVVHGPHWDWFVIMQFQNDPKGSKQIKPYVDTLLH